MTREQLEHLIRAAARISRQRELVIIGSQSILGQSPNAPASLLTSMEADIHPIHDPDKARYIEGAMGINSPFDEVFKYHADGIEGGLPPLPEGWRTRVIPICNENTNWAIGLCLKTHDIAAAKYAAMLNERFLARRRVLRSANNSGSTIEPGGRGRLRRTDARQRRRAHDARRRSMDARLRPCGDARCDAQRERRRRSGERGEGAGGASLLSRNRCRTRRGNPACTRARGDDSWT